MKNIDDLDIWLGAYSYSGLYKFDDENADVEFGLIIYKDDGNYYAEFKNSGYSLRTPDCNLHGMRFKVKNLFRVGAKKRWKEFILERYIKEQLSRKIRKI